MDPERWKRIDEIFHAALDRESSSRAAFLAEACKGDDSLREEVEDLLENHEKQSSLFDSPPTDLAAELLGKQSTFKGAIAHFQILKRIGSGGMGEVYLAEDTRLNRKVALKILPSKFTQDKDRIRRFEKEARTVSGLNHPNILTIYDIGQFDSSSFIASEYIEGETLRERMHKSRMALKEILADPAGKVFPITNDFNNYMMVSMSNDSRFMVATEESYYSNIWIASSSRLETMTPVTSGSTLADGPLGLSWMPDGRIVFSAREPAGDYQISLVNQDRTYRKRLTSKQQHKYWPVASRDGRYIVYMTEDMQIWRIDSDGNNPKLLYKLKPARFPRVSPDGKWVVCSTSIEGKDELFMIDIDGNKTVPLAAHEDIQGNAISPDGTQIAYVYFDEASAQMKINLIAFHSGEILRSFVIPDYVRSWIIHWTPDGKNIAYIKFEDGTSNIYLQPIDGSPVRRLTRFEPSVGDSAYSIRNFSWSMDGKQIAYSRGKSDWDIVLIENLP